MVDSIGLWSRRLLSPQKLSQFYFEALKVDSATTLLILPALLQKLVGDFLFDLLQGNVAINWAGILRDFFVGTGKGVITKGVFSLEGSLESLKSLNSLESLENGLFCPLFSTVWGISRISRISNFSRISRKWTFLKRPLFQKTPGPDFGDTK